MYIQHRQPPHSYNNSLMINPAQYLQPRIIQNFSQEQLTTQSQLLQVSAPSVFQQANLMSRKIDESLKNSRNLPLKFVAQPSLLSQQAVDLKESLDRLKQFSNRKILKQQEEKSQQIQQDLSRQDTFGKERDRLHQSDKSKKFQILPLNIKDDSQNISRVPFDSESASPIKFQVTQQSDSDIPKLYHYQDSESALSYDDKVINIYTQNVYDAEYIATNKEYNTQNRSFKFTVDDKKEIDKQYEEQIMMTQDVIKEEEHQSEQSIDESKRFPKTYSKMTPEEANQAYQGRKQEIKNHLEFAKQATKTRVPKSNNNNLFQKKKTTDKARNISKSPRTEEAVIVIRSIKREPSRKFTPALTPKPQEEKQEELCTSKDFTLFSDKKSALLNDIRLIDREIKLNQNQNQMEQTITQANKSFDNQTKNQLMNQSYQHRANKLYHQGQINTEKKNLVSQLTKAQQKQKELDECTFKPTTFAQKFHSSKNDSTTNQREKTYQGSQNQARSINTLKPSQNLFMDSSQNKKSSTTKKMNKRITSSTSVLNSKVKQRSTSTKQSTSVLPDQTLQDRENYITQQRLQISDYQSSPQSLFGAQPNQTGQLFFDKVNEVTQKYQQILDQANKLKASLRLS